MSEPTSPLQIADYRYYWVSRFLSVIATIGMVVIIGYQLYDVAREHYHMTIGQAAFQLGLLGLAQFIPLFLLTPVAGLVADRFDRRYVAALSTLVDMSIALTLAVATYSGVRSLPLIFFLAACHGTARVFVGPALSAIAPNIVPTNLIPRAIAMSSFAWQSGVVVGPAIFGFLYAGHASLPYWIATGLLAVSMVSILRVKPLPQRSGSDRQAHPIRQIVSGFQFVWNDRFLLGCISLDLFAVLLGGVTALLPIFARDILGVGAMGLGWMRAAPAVGAVIVAAWLSFRPIHQNVGVKMLWAVGIYGLMTAAFALSRDFMLSLLFLALLGAADMVSVFVRSSLIQLNTPDQVRGRVSAISGLFVSASNELGEMRSGVAAALIGVTGAVAFGGVGAIIVTIAWALLFPEIRNARTFAPQYRQRESER